MKFGDHWPVLAASPGLALASSAVRSQSWLRPADASDGTAGRRTSHLPVSPATVATHVAGEAQWIRREFLRISGVGGVGILSATVGSTKAPPGVGQVMTVLGPVRPDQFGSALSHEHVLVDFIGADRVSRQRYDADEAYDVALPYLRRVKDLGCRGFVECTPAYLGRDPRLLERLAKTTGLHILTNTGYYGAAKDQVRAPPRVRGKRGPSGEPVDSRNARWGLREPGSGPGSSRPVWTPGRCPASIGNSSRRRPARTPAQD